MWTLDVHQTFKVALPNKKLSVKFDLSIWLHIYPCAFIFRLWPLMVWGGLLSLLSPPHPDWSPSPPVPSNTHAFKPRRWPTIPTIQFETIWNGSVEVSSSPKITITIALLCHSLILTPTSSFQASMRSPPTSPPPLERSDVLLFVLPGWVAGLWGGVVQHGPDASQQHPKSEEDDVLFGSWPQVQCWGPPDTFAAQPQPSRAPGSPWTRPSQSHGPCFRWEPSTAGERNTDHSPCLEVCISTFCCYFFLIMCETN